MRLLQPTDCEARFDAAERDFDAAERDFDAASMLCAIPTDADGRDTCTGDSGGPLILGSDLDTGPVVAVVSWGRGCGAGWPGVYARANAWPGP